MRRGVGGVGGGALTGLMWLDSPPSDSGSTIGLTIQRLSYRQRIAVVQGISGVLGHVGREGGR